MPGLEFRFVGQDRLPTRLSEFDVERYFALTESDIAALNERFRRDRRAGAAIQLHGYTNVGMAIANLLGFDLCPRLRNLAERKLYLPRTIAAPEGLEAIVVPEISFKAICEGWDELLRLVASIHSGRVSATVAPQRFGSAAHGDPVHRAADQLGKLLRTLFLCDYFSNVEFRRELHTLLNRGESVHQRQRAIYTGRVATERGSRRDEMIAISGSLTLLTNLVIAWNTHRMQNTVDRWRKKDQMIDDDWLRRMGPAHFAHVNFRGTLSFPLDRYVEALLSQHRSRALASHDECMRRRCDGHRHRGDRRGSARAAAPESMRPESSLEKLRLADAQPLARQRSHPRSGQSREVGRADGRRTARIRAPLREVLRAPG